MIEKKLCVPKHIHRLLFEQAEDIHNNYIERSLESQKNFFSTWKEYLWTEQDFLEIINSPEWHIEHGEALLEMKAWAFVSDILRIYALYKYGGVYVDWDVELLRSIPEHFFEKEILLGFEPYTHSGRGTIQVGMHACMSRAGHPFWRELYAKIQEQIWTEDFDILPGTCTRLLEKSCGLPHRKNNNAYYYLKQGICIVPKDIFYPFMGTRVFEQNPDLTEKELYNTIQTNTVAIHWEHSQISDEKKNKKGWTQYFHKLRGDYSLS